MQMHLISALHISHHYAALGKLQLIPAHYPSTKSFCLISSSQAAAEEKQSRPSVEAHLTYSPRCYEDSSLLGLINFNQVGTIRLQNNGDFLLHLLACTFKKPAWEDEGQVQKSGLFFSFFLGVGVGAGWRNQVRTEHYLHQERSSTHLLAPSPY